MAERRRAALALAVVGLAQMGFDLLGWTPGKAIAGATLLSPAPKVFSAVDGFETYSAQFALTWTDRDHGVEILTLERRNYLRVRGPYNRRNVYGAAIAYGPVLRRDPVGARMLDAVGDYAFLGDAPLLAELGIDPERIDGAISVFVASDIFQPWTAGTVHLHTETFLERTP